MEENFIKKDTRQQNDGIARWYVVHTYSGYENKVAANIEKIVENRKLGDIIQDIKVPTEKEIEIKDNKPKEVEKKIYPGYVLVKMILTDDSWYVVRNTRGVTSFVGPGSKPIPLSDKEVEALGINKESKTKIHFDFKAGDTVEIKTGPLNGYMGEISSIDLQNKMAVVFVFMFGRKMNVEIEIDNLQHANSKQDK